MRALIKTVALFVLCPAGLTQAINVDLGPNTILAPVPSQGYGGAANQVGVWNAVPPALSTTPLVDVFGSPISAAIASDSASSATAFPSVMPSGDDQSLMEDFQVTPSLNTLVTWTLTGLADGPYSLVVYASDPTNAAVRVEIGCPASGSPPQASGGGWPGAHSLGFTYVEFFAPVVGGSLEFTAQVIGTQFDSGVVNGFQLVPITVPPLGFNYCSSNSNSTGAVATLTAFGSAVVSDDQFALEAGALPANTFGLFLCSRSQATVPLAGGSQGVLCLGGQIGRFNAQVGQASSAGVYTMCTQGCAPGQSFSLSAVPQQNGTVAIQPGETWSFQFWFRDTVPVGVATSNFTDGFQVSFQ